MAGGEIGLPYQTLPSLWNAWLPRKSGNGCSGLCKLIQEAVKLGVCGLWIVCKNAHLDKHQSLLEDPQLDERYTLACQTFAGHPLQGTVMVPGMCAEGFTEA